jgi:O-antigen ligase
MALPRRVLLAGVTALIVARPFVLGEDPGVLKRPLSDSAGMWLSLLWLLLAVGWAVWRVWSKQGTWYSSLVDVPLAAVVGLVFVSSALAAEYKHPAWLIAWEWLVLLVLFVLVRQLARTAGERRSLLAAVVATGVSVSGHALYQYTIEFPNQRKLAANPQQLQKEASSLGLQADDPNLIERLQEANVFATFAHPNSFAGYLALLLPAAVGFAIVCWRKYGLSWWAVAVTGCALLTGTALWLTHSRGAILASVLVGAVVVVVRCRSSWWRYKGWVLAGTVGLVGVLILALQGGVGKAALARGQASMDLRLGYWRATWRMIRDPQRRLRITEEPTAKEADGSEPATPPSPNRQAEFYPRNWWLGVGPGNFGGHYPRYLAALAQEKVKDPHNFALEMWATSGIFALAALVLALAAFFWQTRSAWTERDPGPMAAEPIGPLRWEFYLGGMLGLTLGFVLQVSSLPQDNLSDRILMAGLTSGASSLVWFAAFALLDNLLWEGPSQVLAMVAGVAALLLNLMVSGGLSFPSVAQPLWTVAALALADRATLRKSAHWLGIVLPLPIVAVVGLIYCSAVFYPVAKCSSALAEARSGEAEWEEAIKPVWQETMNQVSLPPQKKLEATRSAMDSFNKELILYDEKTRKTVTLRAPLAVLREAMEADPEDTYPRLRLAYWSWVQWQMLSRLEEFESDAVRELVRKQQTKLAKEAVDRLKEVWKLDPEGLEGYRLAVQFYNSFAEAPDLGQSVKGLVFRKQLYQWAVMVLRWMLERDPTEAELRYRLADALFQEADAATAIAEAVEARQLRDLTLEESRKVAQQARGEARRVAQQAKVEVAETRQLRESDQIGQRNPTEADLHYRLADGLFKVNEKDEALFQAREGRKKPRYEPPDPQLHYRLAEALFDAGDPAEGGFHAELAAAMDARASGASVRLTEPQREQVKKWLGRGPRN